MIGLNVIADLTVIDADSRPSALYLPAILAAGVKTVLYTGDADWVIPWISNKREAESIKWPCQAEFTAKEMRPYNVKGKEKGTFKTVDNLTYIRVYESGHDLAYFRESPSSLACLYTSCLLRSEGQS